MAFCQNCGAPVEGRYCAKCGAAVVPEAPPEPGSSTIPPPEPPVAALTDNLASALAYIPVVGIIFLLIEPYNRNKTIRFHALQGLFLVVAYIVVNIVVGSLSFLGTMFLLPLIHLAFVGLWLYLMYKTYMGARIVLPIIGAIAQKQA